MKKIISLILAFTLVFCSFIPAYSASETETAVLRDTAEYDGYPFLLVRGMDMNLLTYKLGTDEEEPAFKGVKAGELIGALLKSIAKGIIHWDLDVFTMGVIEYVDDILGRVACNPDGTSKYDVSVKEYPLAMSNYPEYFENLPEDNESEILKTATEVFGAENVYYYAYDWRLDPFMHADRINEYVQRALSETGKDKINIVCASMGGIMTESYLYKYGHESVNRVVFLSSTFCGTYVTTDLFQGKARIDTDALYNFLMLRLGGDNFLLGALYKALYKTGAVAGIAKLGNKFIGREIDLVYDEFLRDSFGTMPSLWALCLPDGYDADIEYMFSGREDKYAELIRLSGQYQEMAAARNDFLQEDDDFFFEVIASYGNANIPVYERGGENGDGTLESGPMLGFATIAKTNETLGDGYTANNPDRLSPDNVVDLSDALYPEVTWAIYGSPHVACNYGTDYSDFVFWIVSCDGRVTVDTNPDYPQFMRSSSQMELTKY